MPEIRYYIVRQTREIKISANDVTEAAIRARNVFNDSLEPADKIQIQQYIRVIDLNIREDR